MLEKKNKIAGVRADADCHTVAADCLITYKLLNILPYAV